MYVSIATIDRRPVQTLISREEAIDSIRRWNDDEQDLTEEEANTLLDHALTGDILTGDYGWCLIVVSGKCVRTATEMRKHYESLAGR